MVEYECERCGYLTDHMSHIKQHLKKAKICRAILSNTSQEALMEKLNNKVKPEPDFSCCGCQTVLSNKFCLQRHHMTCAAYKQYKHAEQLAQQVSQLQSQVQELQATAAVPTPTPAPAPTTTINNNDHSTTNNTHNDHSTTNNINITINNLGNEDISHLTPEFYKACVQNGVAGLIKFIDKVHFDEEHPENKNVKHLSKKQQLLYKYEDGKWVECDRNFTLNTMIDKNKGRLQRFIMTNEPLLGCDDEQDHMMLIDGYHKNYEILKIGTQQFYALRREVFSLVLKNDEDLLG